MLLKLVFSLFVLFFVTPSYTGFASEFELNDFFHQPIEDNDLFHALSHEHTITNVSLLLRRKSIYALYGLLIAKNNDFQGISPEHHVRSTYRKPSELVARSFAALGLRIDLGYFQEAFFVGKKGKSLDTWKMTACELYAHQNPDNAQTRDELYHNVCIAYRQLCASATENTLAKAHLAFHVLQMLMIPGLRIV